MPRKPKGVFISCRRETGSHLAGRINAFLEDQGYEPLLDAGGPEGGHWSGSLSELQPPGL